MHSGKQRDDRLAMTRERARISPVRASILDLLEAEKDDPRSLDAERITEELQRNGWQVSLSQVTYHLRWLVDAELISAPCRGG